MTTYRCAACGKDVETEEIELTGAANVIEVKPCEVCVGVAEEGARDEAHERGYQEGWQAGYDTMSEEVEEVDGEEEYLRGLAEGKILGHGQTYKDGYDKGRQDGEVKSNSGEYSRGFEAGLEVGKKEDTKDERH